ncbi:hypothetical protein B0J14DRAFT_22263 [Halenospora varia]|nr:hypothetical protein B0J14DRAFT_22263 [Halenospora varia]
MPLFNLVAQAISASVAANCSFKAYNQHTSLWRVRPQPRFPCFASLYTQPDKCTLNLTVVKDLLTKAHCLAPAVKRHRREI